MTNVLKNEKGLAVNIALAMVLVAVVMSAMVSLINLNIDDRNTFIWAKDKLQQELLIRSETIRVNLMLSNSIFSDRTVEIVGPHSVTTHAINYRRPASILTTEPTFLGDTAQINNIAAMVVTKHSRRNIPTQIYNPEWGQYKGKSPTLTYFDKFSRRQSLAQFQWFSDKEISNLTNDPNHEAAWVRFNGDDTLWGPVHSNDHIVIQNVNGWPIFHSPVTTSGFIWVMSGTNRRRATDAEKAPAFGIFRAGVKEEVPPILYTPNADLIRRNGRQVFENNPPDIAYAVIEGTQVSFDAARITILPPEPIVVYSSYPDLANAFVPNPPFNPTTNPMAISTINMTATNQPNFVGRLVGDSLWTNYVSFPQTVWTPSPNQNFNNSSMMVHTNLWVRGEVSGKFTIASSKDSYITGNITYAQTNQRPGAEGRPDDPNSPNRMDYFGLVSEKSIYLKYLYRGPDGSVKDGMTATNGTATNFYMYGAYSAQGDSDPSLGTYAWKGDGEFSYEYQHPKGSPIPYHGFRYRRDPDNQNQAIPVDFYPVYDDDGVLVGRIPYTVDIQNIDMHRLKYPPDPPVQNASPPFSWRRWPGYTGDGVGPAGAQAQGFPNVTTTYQQAFYRAYDYPFHNPIYPQPVTTITVEIPDGEPLRYEGIRWMRGTLNVYGAIAQRRRGYMRRSGTMRVDNPDTQNWWDPGEYDHFGPPFWSGGQYVFGGSHPATGYNRNFFFDNRFYFITPPDYPEVYTGAGANRMSSFDETTWNIKPPPRNWHFSSF